MSTFQNHVGSQSESASGFHKNGDQNWKKCCRFEYTEPNCRIIFDCNTYRGPIAEVWCSIYSNVRLDGDGLFIPQAAKYPSGYYL